MRHKVLLLPLLLLSCVVNSAVIDIDFESEVVGTRDNGFSAGGVSAVKFSSTIGSNLRVYTGSECGASKCLLEAADDDSAIRIDLSFIADSISFEFGNDEPYLLPFVKTAALYAYRDGGIVGSSQVMVNNSDALDQSIIFSGTGFDSVVFQYLDDDGKPAVHAEVIDNIQINAVPLPAAAWLFSSALLGLGVIKRRKAG